MDKRERFLKVVNNQPVDRVPVAFFHHFCSFDDFGKGLYDDAIFKQNVEGHRKAREVFDPDVIKIMNDSLMTMPVDASFVATASDLRRIRPLGPDSAFFKKSIELTKTVLEVYKDSEAPKFITSFSPTFLLREAVAGTLPVGGADESKLLGLFAEEPDAVEEALKYLAEGVAQLNRALMEQTDIDGIYYSVNNQSAFFSDEDYRKYVSPHDKFVLDEANKLGQMNMLHICGFAGRGNNLKLFTEFEAAVYNWAVHAEGVTLSEGKKLFGGKAVCGGFAQNQTIYTGTREEVEAATFNILDEAGTLGVMIGADCTVPNDIDDIRLEWVRQAAIKYAAK